MMTDLNRAKELLKANKFSCVLFGNGVTYTSTGNGVAPLVDWLVSGTDFKGFSAADKVVGKAAAFLWVLAGIKEVYATVMSQPAADVFSRFGVSAKYETLVKTIFNRHSTGPCPIEQAVSDIEDPAEAFAVIQNTLAVLKARRTGNT